MYSQTVRQLLALQEIDSQLYELRKSRDAIPDKEQRLKAPMEEAQARRRTLDEEHAQHVNAQKELRQSLRGAKRNLADCEAQFATVTSDEEYQAKQQEVRRWRDDIVDFEDQLLRLQEDKASVATALAEADQAAKSHMETCENELASLSITASAIEQEIHRLEDRHTILSVEIEEADLALYKRTRGRRGVRIAAVKRGACGGCHTQFPPQTLAEIRHAASMRTCVNCGCITIWDEDS